MNAMGIWQRIRHLLVVKVHTFSEPEGAASCTDGQAAHWAAPAGRLILLGLPTYSPWLNPIEMVWRHFKREVTYCELFSCIEAFSISFHSIIGLE